MVIEVYFYKLYVYDALLNVPNKYVIVKLGMRVIDVIDYLRSYMASQHKVLEYCNDKS